MAEEVGREDWTVVRELYRHENELINHRITWMVTFHSLLVAAVSFAWQSKDVGFLVGLAVVGMIISISSGISIILARRAQDELVTWWRQNGPKYAGVPRLFHKSDVAKVYLIMLPWYFWPWFSLFAWTVTLGYVVAKAW